MDASHNMEESSVGENIWLSVSTNAKNLLTLKI